MEQKLQIPARYLIWQKHRREMLMQRSRHAVALFISVVRAVSRQLKLLPLRSSGIAALPTRFWAFCSIGAAAAFCLVTAFGTAPDTRQIDIAQQAITEKVTLDAQQVTANNTELFTRQEAVRSGDTVADLLHRLGVSSANALEQLRANTPQIFRALRPGTVVTARVRAQGELVSLDIPLKSATADSGTRLDVHVEREGQGFAVSDRQQAVESLVRIQSGEIKTTLFAAADAAEIPEETALQLTDIFGGEIDFSRGLRIGDHFTVIRQAFFHNGRELSGGRVLAAEFDNDGVRHSALWYVAADGQGDYYDRQGHSLRKMFLRSPLEISRVSSGFSRARLHPILQRVRAHRGVDYAAPSGTHVRAAGDGVVEFVGNRGGYGHVIVINHQNGHYQTVYGHLSGYAVGIGKGVRVKQGQLIGYVGMTGLATGPHLHYEFHVDGVYRNPLTVALPTARPLPREEMGRFQLALQAQINQLNLVRNDSNEATQQN